MKFTLENLKKYIATDKSLNEILSDLVKIGLEVENYKNYNEILADFSVAKILATNKHPNADKLKICKVQTIFGIKDVVCGASNARENITVVYAKDGAIIPKTNAVLKKNEIRGVMSDGMLCSSNELNLGEDSEGILELDNSIEVGVAAAVATKNDDVVIEVAITPNKGDFLAIKNIASELNLLGGYKLIEQKQYSMEKLNSITEKLTEIKDSEFCKGFYLIKIENLEKNIVLPSYMEKKLRLLDLLTNIAIVDFVNYIGMEYNQPMHVYDLDKLIQKKLQPKIVDKEINVVSLDGKEYKLLSGDIAIFDGLEVASIAGIMGSEYCKVDNDTKNILIEIANFNKSLIGLTKRRLNINSDASYRFERGIDLLNIENVVAVVCNLFENELKKSVNRVYSYLQSEAKNIIVVSMEYLRKMLNLEMDFLTIKNILEKLSFKVSELKQDNFEVEVPSFRHDFFDKSDVLEEIVKFVGFDNILEIDVKNQVGKNVYNSDSLGESKVNIINTSLYYMGFVEMLNMSFISEAESRMYNIFNEKLQLINPIAQDFAVMRSSLIPSLLKNLAYNNSYGNFNLKIYEVADCYFIDKIADKNGGNLQEKVVAGLLSGYKFYKDAINKEVKFNVYDAKEVLFNVMVSLGFNPNNLQISNNKLPCYYHPFKSGSLNMGKNLIAYFGEVHPYFVKKLGLKEDAFCFELFVDSLLNNEKTKNSKVKNIAKDVNLMSLYRDFAFVVDENVLAIDLINAVKSADKNYIKEVRLFDVYILNDGKKSLAVNVEIIQIGKTLNEVEIKEIYDKIVLKVLKIVNGLLRE
jgi:phenylalanyl-tRNA synthetase beta chain